MLNINTKNAALVTVGVAAAYGLLVVTEKGVDGIQALVNKRRKI